MLTNIAGSIVVGSPALLLAVIGLSLLFGHQLQERTVARLTQSAVVTGLVVSLLILIMMLFQKIYSVPVHLGHWVEIEEQHFHFNVKFVFDRLSVPFVILTFVLCGVIGAFASRYLHRDPGYHRFFLFYALFLLGMVLSSLAGTIETLFLGWELVGLSSALLVAFFHNRKNPVRNGQRVWAVYRIADAAFLIAALVLHHLTGGGDFSELMGAGTWPESQAMITSGQALVVGLLLLVAAAGKSALVPFSGWLPRAMEGPTPSSAVFYGALSVHLGAYLLLRVSPLLERSAILSVAVFLLGLITAVYAAMVSRVQTDVKSSLAFASLTQVSIIVVEIGCGLRYLALCHIIGHACMRTLQLLRAPSLLKDYYLMENAIGDHLPDQAGFWRRLFPASTRQWFYRFALERGCLDSVLDDYVVRPFIGIFLWSDRMERRWTDFLSGQNSGVVTVQSSMNNGERDSVGFDGSDDSGKVSK
ncbi:MAG: proton-conducting transporter membrane subunit [Planctomyces sp.]